ncbi:MAG TPA: molybdopterin-guanine dinucleotide biosynthesis protein B [Archaeoglobaceae archaeon]|nr:molybdopterin-guanine dinucleotide biosynthesis protein B [Archaeoglobaceae archaeon]
MIISILGNSKAGKTSLITGIVPILREKGLKVAVVKHTYKEIEIDRKGKDSWKIFESGADVILSSPHKMAFIKREEDNLDRLYEYLREYDIVFTEGFSEAGRDRIVVVNDISEIERFKNGRILAIVSDDLVEGYRHFRRDDISGISEFILSLHNDNLQGQKKHAETQAY